jgi:hypothetical protein
MADTQKFSGGFGAVLEYLFGRLKAERPVTVKVGEEHYAIESDGTLGDAVRALEPQWDKPTLRVSTLSGLAGAVLAGLDGLDQKKIMVTVTDVHTVVVSSIEANEFGRRHSWAIATHQPETKFEFDKYYDTPEKFIIAFRASFYFNDNAVKVQQVCSTVGAGEAVMVADDGVSQDITIKAGTVTRSTLQLPADGIPLVPWRTFRDAAPVESKFLLRMKGVKDALPHIALFEIDAKWRVDTMQSIAAYLATALPGVTIIA